MRLEMGVLLRGEGLVAKRAADSLARIDPHLTISRSVCRARPLPPLPLSSEHPIFASIKLQVVSFLEQLRAVNSFELCDDFVRYEHHRIRGKWIEADGMRSMRSYESFDTDTLQHKLPGEERGTASQVGKGAQWHAVRFFGAWKGRGTKVA